MIALELHTKAGRLAARVEYLSPGSWRWHGTWGAGCGDGLTIAATVRERWKRSAGTTVARDGINELAPTLPEGPDRDTLIRLAGLVAAIHLLAYQSHKRKNP